MAKLTAAPDIIIVDVDAGETSGSSSTHATKTRWERTAGSGESIIDLRASE
jgi:hypothetical protein